MNKDSYDARLFLSEVLEAVSELEHAVSDNTSTPYYTIRIPKRRLWWRPASDWGYQTETKRTSAVVLKFKKGIGQLFKSWRSEKDKEKFATTAVDELRQLENEAKVLTNNNNVKSYLCSALKAVSDDSMEIAKFITPVLVGAVLAGTITMPLNPLLFGMVAFIIARVGVATYCCERGKD